MKPAQLRSNMRSSRCGISIAIVAAVNGIGTAVSTKFEAVSTSVK